MCVTQPAYPAGHRCIQSAWSNIIAVWLSILVRIFISLTGPLVSGGNRALESANKRGPALTEYKLHAETELSLKSAHAWSLVYTGNPLRYSYDI